MDVSFNSELYNQTNIFYSDRFNEITLEIDDHFEKYYYDLGKLIVGEKTDRYQIDAFSVIIESIDYTYGRQPIINFLINYNFQEYYNENFEKEIWQIYTNLNVNVFLDGNNILYLPNIEFDKKGDFYKFSLNLNDYENLNSSKILNLNIELVSNNTHYKQNFGYKIILPDIRYTSNIIDLTEHENAYNENNIFSFDITSNLELQVIDSNLVGIQELNEIEFSTKNTNVNYEFNSDLVSTYQKPISWIVKTDNLDKNSLFLQIDEIFFEIEDIKNETNIIETKLEWELIEDTYYLIFKEYFYYDFLNNSVIISKLPKEGYERTLFLPIDLIGEKLKIKLKFGLEGENFEINIPFNFFTNKNDSDFKFKSVTKDFSNLESTYTIECEINSYNISNLQENNYYRWCYV